MRKRPRILLAVLIVAVVGWIAWLTLRPSEPMYKGKPLSFWLEGYVYDPRLRPEADEAVRHIGTNAIPILLRLLQAKDSPLNLRLISLASKQHVFRIKHVYESDKHTQAVNGFKALGAGGKIAVPELIRIYKQADSAATRTWTAISLGNIGPAARAAVPCLVQGLGDTNGASRMCTASALGDIHAQPELAVPALTKCLTDRDVMVRVKVGLALMQFGAEAKAAVPALVEMLGESDSAMQRMAKAVLSKIDPEDLARAGGK